MSLYGAMNTSISGMQAQTNRLSSVGENVANASTTGYKSSEAHFSSMVMPTYNSTSGYNGHGSYQSGFVETTIRRTIDQQGDLSFTKSGTDLAIVGNGYFVVQDQNGKEYLSRAGDFQADDEGYLLNSGNYRLTGYRYDEANGVQGTTPEAIQLGRAGLSSRPSTAAIFDVNVPIDAEPVDAADKPSGNLPNSAFTNRTSLTAYDNAGRAVQLDVYYAKLADNSWEVSVFNRADSLTGGFPYGVAGSAPLASSILTFDPTTNGLTEDVVLDVPLDDIQTITLDVSGSTQLASGFVVTETKIDGSKPSAPTGYSISPDGLVSAKYEDGTTIPIYTVAMADVMSPNNMTSVDGTAFLTNNQSGPAILGYAGIDGMGTLKSGAFENSNVDLAEQLTNMIESQRTYTANSKVFQTGSEMFDTLNNLKR